MYNGALYALELERASKKAMGRGNFYGYVLPELVRKLFDNTLVECVRESQYLSVNIVEG